MKAGYLKRAGILVLSCSMMIGALAGCGAKAEEEKVEETTKEVVETTKEVETVEQKNEDGFDTTPVTLTVYCDYAKSSDFDWGEDDVSKWITEQTGVTLDIKYDPAGDGQKLKLMIASGEELPDIIVTEANGVTANLLYEEECVQPLNKLGEEYFPKFNELLPYQMKEVYQKDDGNLYCVVDWFGDVKKLSEIEVGAHGADQTVTVNKTFYEEMGSPEINSLDDLKEVLIQFKEKHPEINNPVWFDSLAVQWPKDGTNTLYRLHGGADYLYPDENNNIKFCYEDERYKETLRYMNELYREGLINPDMPVMEGDASKAILSEGRIFTYIGQAANWMNTMEGGTTKDSIVYTLEPPMAEGVSRDDLQLKDVNLGIGGWHGTFISADCKNVERAIQYLAFRYTDEMQLTERYGVEGKAWTMNETGSPVPTQELLDAQATSPEALAVYGRNNWDHSWFTTNWVVALGTAEAHKNEPANQQNQGIWTKYCKNERMIDLTKIITDETIKVKADQVYKIWDEAVMKLIFAKDEAEFDQTYEKFLKDVEGLGSKDLAAYYTQNYADWQKKLG